MPVPRGWGLIFAKPKGPETELLKQPVHVPCARVCAQPTHGKQGVSRPPLCGRVALVGLRERQLSLNV